jgi:acyl-CoA thioester hydrolase
MISYKNFKHIVPIQIRFSDIDRLDHVNNACYHNYFELGRVKYFNDVFKKEINWNEKGFVLARTEIDHIEPVFLNDIVHCCTKVIRLGNKSLTIANSLIKEQNGSYVECASGIGILVAMDYSSQQSILIPEKWAELMRQYEDFN